MKNIKNLHLGNNIPQGIKKENYKINGVEYKHNSKGYRCAEFEKTNSLKVFSRMQLCLWHWSPRKSNISRNYFQQFNHFQY